MSRKDYIAIAAVLHGERNSATAEVIDWIAVEFAALFKADNSNFDKARFIAAVKEG